MFAVLLILAFAVQDAPARSAADGPGTGTVTGTVTTTDGKPAVAVRVAARVLQDSAEEANGAEAFASLAQTDTDGRYRLENIPAGRYVITAGWVGVPTYYPGARRLTDATPLSVAAGATLSNINFGLQDVSYSTVKLPLKITVAGGGTLAGSGTGPIPRLRLLNEINGQTVLQSPLDASFISIPYPLVDELLLAIVENLPPGYSVQSITYGPQDLRRSGLRLSRTISLNEAAVLESPPELAITLAPPATPQQ
jgi:hypothetical protein